jgi:hypothetical protein
MHGCYCRAGKQAGLKTNSPVIRYTLEIPVIFQHCLISEPFEAAERERERFYEKRRRFLRETNWKFSVLKVPRQWRLIILVKGRWR